MADTSQVREITARLEQGVKDLFTSDTYADYLKTMSRFYQYSTRNTLLIHMQMPGATHVAGFGAWQNKFGRHVVKGAKSIKILAPTPFVIREEKEKLDPDTRRPILDENGMPVVEETERRLARFKVVSVFDISQTDGKPLPSLAKDLTGDVEQYAAFMDALKAVSPLPIVFEPLPPDTDGVCTFGDKISIREGMSEIQSVSAVIHEITHAKLHDLSLTVENGENAKPKDRRTEEVEAESVSYAVCQFFGIETGANSFGYLAEWSKGRELKELNASLDTIRKTAAELIDAIDGRFREIAKDRDIVFAVGEAQEALSEPGEQPDAVSEISAPASAALPVYLTVPPETRQVGTNVLMTPVFDESRFNRSGKKIRVTIEEPIGKYSIYSHEENGDKNLYFLTASGRIDRTAEYFRNEWDEQQDKYVNIRPTEAEFDEAMATVAERFERDMSDPTKWAMYQHAAALNRLDDCDAHNAPVRKLREEADRIQREGEKREEQEIKRQNQERLDARIDEIAKAVEQGKTISVSYDEYLFDGKNPVLDLFRLYGVDLPLRTQGWVNSGLAEISESGYRYYSSKHKRNSTTFSEYFAKLREAIKAVPIEQKRAELNPEKSDPTAEADKFIQEIVGIVKERRNTLEEKLYNKFAEMFPQFISGEYRHMRLEAGAGMMPLSLEWLNSHQISVMHTYKQNGDTCYDPMIVFEVGYGENDVRTLTAVEYEQSIPPLYQVKDSDGRWRSVDGNGNEKTVFGLQKSINEFASQWFNNIAQQGYMPVRANMTIDGEETQITFDADGKPIIPEPEKPEKQYDLGYGHMGNGLTVWNRLEEKNGDYVTVAHIDPDRSVKFYDKDMPDSIKAQIEHEARTSDARVSYTQQDQRVFNSPPQEYNREYDDVPLAFETDGKPITPEPSESFEVTVFTHEDGGYDALSGVFDNRQDAEAYARLLDNSGCYGVSLRAVVDGEEYPLKISMSLEDAQNNKNATEQFAKFKEGLDPTPEADNDPASLFPDTSTGLSEMNLYGYAGDEMLPLMQNRAVELYDLDHTIYLLYPDNTEAMAFDRDEILSHDGLFGIESAEWEASREFAAMKAAIENSEGSREAMLLYGSGDRFGIYQIKGGDEMRDYLFEAHARLNDRGLSVNRGNYELVHTMPFSDELEPLTNKNDFLNQIYETFNTAHPEGYTGRSVSVSDVIVIKYNGEISSHYVDSFKFMELPSFLGDETQKAQAVETPAQSYSQLGNSSQPTVAELEADIKAGKSISIIDLSKALNADKVKAPISKGKPTLMARLEENKRKAAQQGQPDAHKAKERDV